MAAQSNSTPKRTFLSEKFKYPFTFEEAGHPTWHDNSSTQSNRSRTVTQTSPTAIANEVSNVVNKSTYAGIVSGVHDAPRLFRPSPKFLVPFDESPAPSVLDSIDEKVDNKANDVE